jgi:hypothetical protein
MVKDKTAKKGEREPAHKLFIKLLRANNLAFFVRKQEIRYIEDNGILIEPPKVIIYYIDEAKKLN